jgi:hypothetical protein
MASILKAQKANAANSKGKRKADDMDVDQPAPKRSKNKQRVLLLSSRGVTHRMRHLMNDLEVLLPHVKRGTSMCLYRKRDVPYRIQTRNSIRKIICICYRNLRTSTIATIRYILKRDDMRICTCGRQKRRTDRV